ncbi:hypothetical protein AN640_08660 [Candidatus Epulonipiscium fishelsonii]|uniref:Uncharacterized protein n=1 Tax=Candidatus Epulonipiscium fishelsonii TaxID=77094 RepID=A0ACC8XCZ4_9FIRM|nr:hypothetical protein AN640_08660 [Epulopiscium sp. SCG-D08WGA-EpuloA1]OON96316.1 MAG: hypothetical protein ATN32_06500 [Epulopiscium sp. AS2M-Bin002]
MSKIFGNDSEYDAFSVPEEEYMFNIPEDNDSNYNIDINLQTWTMALIIGYLILKNVDHILDLSQWPKTDLLLVVAVGIWGYRYYVLNIGV